ncbi:MAG: glutamate 5-kinase [Nitrososphaerota archaeon]|jgi:glutamate 5-kinase|nr:glutamate 5-kinase [Nitrososphaerota archaeon]
MTPKLIVIKVGTSGITTNKGKLDQTEMQNLAQQIAVAAKQGNRIIFVSSGAVAAGIAELKMPQSSDIVFQQVAAATGQSVLMTLYRKFFKKHNLKVAQILLTAEDLSSHTAYNHTCDVLNLLLEIGVIPIINENDVTSVEELMHTENYQINFSDNDSLSVLVANAISADLVIILSDVEGLYTKDPTTPGAELIQTVEEITPELKISLSGKSKQGRGGIQSKIKAAEIATHCGIPVIIANSRHPEVITKILADKTVGTYFKPQNNLPAAKRWLAYGATTKGTIYVKKTAKTAILNGASLLPADIIQITGIFNQDEVVCIADENTKFAKGTSNFNSTQLNLIKGLQISEVQKKLGTDKPREAIKHQNIHLTEEIK